MLERAVCLKSPVFIQQLLPSRVPGFVTIAYEQTPETVARRLRLPDENRFGCMESPEIPTLEIPTSSSDGRCFPEGFGRSVVARLRSSKRGGHIMLAALMTRRNCHGPTLSARPGPQSALKFGARAPMRQPYRGATRGVGRLEIGPNDAAFRHFAQRPMIQDSAAGTDDDGHGKIGRTHDEQHGHNQERRCTRANADGIELLR